MNKDDVVDGGDTCSRCPELLPWDALYLDNGERLCNHCEDRANKTPRSIAARLVEWADDAGADGMAGTATLCRQAADALTTLSAENEALKHDVQRQMAIANEHVNENATLSARVETLEAALRAIAGGTKISEKLFKGRLGNRKSPTWFAVNILQDSLSACQGTAERALAGDDHG